MAQIFISYGSGDLEYAGQVRSALKNRGYSVWLAPTEIGPGEDFVRDISRNLEEARAVVLILSKNSMESPWVETEIAHVKESGKPLYILKVDHQPLNLSFRFLLTNMQYVDAYGLPRKALDDLVDWASEKLGSSTVVGGEEIPAFSALEHGIRLISRGDPYFVFGDTLRCGLSGLRFLLSPPKADLEAGIPERLAGHFSEVDEVFGSSLEAYCASIPIDGLLGEIERSRSFVFRQFVRKENGCYFNNGKYGVSRMNPFGRTEDLREAPELTIEFFETDYFTHRVMKDVCKRLIARGDGHLLNGIDYAHLGHDRIFMTSLGLNILVVESDYNRTVPSVILTSRSTRAAETYGVRQISCSAIEGVSGRDYEGQEGTVDLRLAAVRGIEEELGITPSMLDDGSLRFYELWVNQANLELGLSCSVNISQGMDMERDVLALHGKDEALEVGDKLLVGLDDLARFVRDNEAYIMPQALFAILTYLEANGHRVIDRFELGVHREEEFVMGKRGTVPCGDSILNGEHFIAVFDGVTPKGERLWEGMPGDVFVSGLLASTLAGIGADADAPQVLEELNGAIRDAYIRHGTSFDELPVEERLGASAVIYSRRRREVWSFGDCQLRISGRNHRSVKKVDELLSTLRAFYVEDALLDGRMGLLAQASDYGREMILPLIKEGMRFSNLEGTFGYDVLDGGRIHTGHVTRYRVQRGDFVVLASDGYPRLFDTLGETESYLRDALREDPHCIGRLMGTKGMRPDSVSYDDRSYVSFTVR